MDGHNSRAQRLILALEEAFNKCPHPDATQLADLSRDTGMEPRQIKCWFQNRRTQIKPSRSSPQGSSSSDP
ncbi:hypothetical protein ZWY2020_054423 [Hordeum vulgare]|nr:hypothetical protein ZWY2020_054423 [Hordeum vulgare]